MPAETTSLPGGKLTLVFRIEPGCLGPDGKDYIEEFCLLVQKAFEQTHQRTVVLEIIPRFDKQLPETEYRIGERGLSREKAARLLSALGKDLDALESQLNDALPNLIEHYLARG
jgi:hypothetical protein